MKFKAAAFSLLSALVVGAPAVQAETPISYCAAIRGNGDSMPAHWGALAETMETYGDPQGLAGGSSGSITTFLWESSELNPALGQSRGFERGDQLALMFKSLEGVTYHIYEKPEWKTFALWLSNAHMTPKALQALLAPQNLEQVRAQLPLIKSALVELKRTGLFFGPAVQTIVPRPSSATLLWNKIQALQKTLAVFGKFDAKSDAQIFLRPGVVNFGQLALKLGALGDYLSLHNASDETKSIYSQFIATCTPGSKGLSWQQLVQARPDCADLLNRSVDSYFAMYATDPSSRIYEKIGAHSRAIVSTSVVDGASAEKYRAIAKTYQSSFDSTLGGEFTLQEQDLHFGYWGRASDLNRIRSVYGDGTKAFGGIDKVKRFMPLGEATWLQILSLSPAEPGLSSALEFSSVGLRQNLISFGGWSDLHPIQVLKAAGCEHVVYLQRRGGDALFSEGVVKRLLNYPSPDWSQLNDQLNNAGSATDLTSTWSKLFNVRNPKSNYAASIQEADAVLCSDWNAFDSKKQFTALIEDSFQAPFFEKVPLAHAPGAKPKLLTTHENQVDAQNGFAPYVGCIPLE